ncbi:MAG: bifunctional (p)ppGpp synthetase/guanosine-3',5'-bis(diphosphate) 3'-pyrophosphohydrolase [PS1 clade bacterium]|uniref:GTP pyrophosphokinase rsh n=1 Tax=PS1 clade bacterium TaxID=2175152 RepID=A0A368E2A3_9PROT|nr:MAG: bifunctional (p)ppGpp synthetase/guanosine-3',5'-bis(diphosphate) 3'-pyrophosphohydrolase [PS1 clade bacterium]|tara:strand:- start:3264 stop:5420 length:2157 start_codon:yes stop_codon:yes gene_type:complete
MMRQFELVDKVSGYLSNLDENLLNQAYVFTVKKHGDQKRASGDPYFSHPVEVAGILTELKLDEPTIVTGLLHDTLEDTDATYEELQRLFGEEVAQLVDGVTKLSKLELTADQNKQAENFRKLLVATANDIRVLIVKLADRLHNMRTLHYIQDPKRKQRIAQETLEIYAPLAGRMGIQSFREELEDLSFKMLKPQGYSLISDKLVALKAERSDMLDSIAYDLKNLLTEEGVEAAVEGREKSPFSIWRKMENKSISLEQLSDIFGFRVIVNGEVDCYRALGAVHRKWQFVPGRFKDYISVPKTNNYRSLHTTIIGPNRQRVEIQIRTSEMHTIAQNGVAAHWLYKDSDDERRKVFEDIKPFKWLQELVDQLKIANTAEEFLEDTKMELFHDQVFCFTPKGRIIALPKGATPLDFAYAVHTEVGNSCAGARVNGNITPIRTVLRNGDEVEIIRAEGQLPSANWESIVVTGKARAAIRHHLRENEHLAHIRTGREIIASVFQAEKKSNDDNHLERALVPLDCETLDDLYAMVGGGEVSGTEVFRKVYPDQKSPGMLVTALNAITSKVGSDGKKNAPVIGGDSFSAIKFAPDTFPLPGDRIVGIMTPGEGVMVYPISSPLLQDYEAELDRWLPLKWDDEASHDRMYDTRLSLTVANKIGALAIISRTIGEFGANISNLSMNQRDEDFCLLEMDLEVRDLNHVKEIISALRGSRLVNRVKRVVA